MKTKIRIECEIELELSESFRLLQSGKLTSGPQILDIIEEKKPEFKIWVGHQQ